MAAYFLETSALVKRYVQETGTPWVEGLLLPVFNHTFYIAQIAGVEAIAAITLRARRGDLSHEDSAAAIADFRHDYMDEYNLAQITPPLISHVMNMAEKHGLRGYDAVQLASALQVQADRQPYGLPAPIFLSADNALNVAASAEGLAVDNPNAHL